MGTGRSAAYARYMSMIHEAGTATQLSDGQLLERFAGRRSGSIAAADAAFAALMARHGPMVLGICRRALIDRRDVEDAFQATFLVLVRKASSIRVGDSLAPWLHGVARRVTARARKSADRRRMSETQPCGDSPARLEDETARAELMAVLDEELARLPPRYRAPLVLCYLEGVTNEEAARRLQCPLGTVQSRMARGRVRLRARLTRRGLVPAALATWLDLALGSARAAVPPGLESSTIRLASGRGADAARAAAVALSEGMMRSMTMTRIATTAAILGVAVATAAGSLARTSDVPPPAHRPPAGGGVGRPATAKKLLAFPGDRSLGVLYARDPGDHRDGWGLADDPWAGWEQLGEATGPVEIAAGREVRLAVRTAACDDLSPLRRLDPGDLTAIDFRGAAIGPGALGDVAHLSGVRNLRFLNCRIDDRDLKPLAVLGSLRTLDFTATPIGDAGVAHVASLPALSSLGLGRTRVTEKGVALVAKMASLRRIDLTADEVGDRGLAALQGASGLERLTIAYDHYVTDGGLKHLSRAANLRYLDLSNTGVGDAGLAHLAGLGRLEFLRLSETKVGDAGLAHLKCLKALKVLLPPAGITDAGLAEVGQLASLRHLFLSYGPITDVGVAHLAGLEHLERLAITCTEGKGITDASVPSMLKLRKMNDLSLYITALTDDGLAGLSGLDRLEKLSIGSSKVTWDGLAHLSRFPALRELNLAGVGGRPTLEHLRPLKGLRLLRMHGNGRFDSDADLAHLGTLTHLETLRVQGVPITDEGMRSLAGLTMLRELSLYDHESIRVGDAGLPALEGMQKLESLQITGPITDRGLEPLSRLGSLRVLDLGSRTVSDEAIAGLRRRLRSLQEVRKSPLRTSDAPPAIGQAAPDFEVKTLAGDRLRLRDLRGRTTLLYFWATWCSPCVSATPEIVKLQERLATRDKSFSMISLSLDESDNLARRHSERHGLRWPQAWIGMDSPVRERYGVIGAPTYVVVDPAGNIGLITNKLDDVTSLLEDARR